jgi:hypothetical protein
MNVTPVLVCQGFQQGFIEPGSPLFSVSASMRRTTCETVLRRARRSDWTVIHTFLGADLMHGADEATIPGFQPLPTEPWFRQTGPSAFGPSTMSAFEKALFAHHVAPVFLISFGGLPVVAATLMAGLVKRFAMQVVTDAVADVASHGASEMSCLEAIETLARTCGCAITSSELATLSPAHQSSQSLSRPESVPYLLSQSGR